MGSLREANSVPDVSENSLRHALHSKHRRPVSRRKRYTSRQPHFGQTGSPLVSAQRTAMKVVSASSSVMRNTDARESVRAAFVSRKCWAISAVSDRLRSYMADYIGLVKQKNVRYGSLRSI